MKRLFLLATAAIVALASCSKTQVVYTDAPEQITFKQVTNAMTKAPTALNSGILGVFAHQGESEYFGNSPFTWKDTESVFKGGKQWPQTGDLDFTVYYPYSADAKYNVEEKQLTIPASSNIDGVYYGVKRYTDKNSANQEPVVLNHVCAKITVKFDGGELYNFSSASIAGVNTAGNVAVNYADPVVVTTVAPDGGEITTGNLTFYTSDAINYALPGSQKDISVSFTQKTGSQSLITKPATLSGTWDANKHYVYNIKVGDTGEITFAAQTNDWEDAGATEKVLN